MYSSVIRIFLAATLVGHLTGGLSSARADSPHSYTTTVHNYASQLKYCSGTAVAIHGIAHTASSWDSFAQQVSPSTKGPIPVCRLVAINLPGHGPGLPRSSDPLFGNLSLTDSVTALDRTLRDLRDNGTRIRVLLAHSQGALLVQLLADQLTEQGTSLARKFRVSHVVFLAPSMPREIDWATANDPAIVELAQSFIVEDELRGAHLSIPAPAWIQLFFGSVALGGATVPGAPEATEAQEGGWIARAPLVSTLQLIGAFPGGRLSVQPLLFRKKHRGYRWRRGPRTKLVIVSFENDTFVRPSEADELYVHLTGDTSLAGRVEVTGETAIHDMYILDPVTVRAAIPRSVPLP